MFKTGKKYRLYTNDYDKKTKPLYDIIKKTTIEKIDETFNPQLRGYEGKIILKGKKVDLLAVSSSINSLNLFSTEPVSQNTNISFSVFGNNSTFSIPINGSAIDSVFDIETHYEELKELQTKQILLSGSGKNIITDLNQDFVLEQTYLTGNVVSSLADNLDVYKFKSSFEYNFLVKNYETNINNSAIKETALPDFYEVLSTYIDSNTSNDFDPYFFDKPINIKERNQLSKTFLPYYINYDKKSLRIDKFLEKFNGFKEQFPFYTDISFDTHELKQKSFSNLIFNYEEIFNNFLFNISASLSISTIDSASKQYLSGASMQTLGGRPIDIERVLGTNSINVDSVLYNRIAIEQGNLQINKYSFIFEANQIINDNRRTFLSVLKGEPNYSEVFGYHLRKFESSSSANPIQEIFFPNTSDGKMFWVDTQIKYNKPYTYRLDPIILTFVTQYKFTDVVFKPSVETNTEVLELKFFYRPLPRMYIFKNTERIQLKYFGPTNSETFGAKYTNRLLDYPPNEPEIDIIPYIGIDNKIKLNFNTSIGKKTVPAINFSPEEFLKQNILREAQNLKPFQTDLLTFQTDEPAETIEIYRIENNKPLNYYYFNGKLLTTLSTNNSSGASFIDTIEPNKKYYYIARCMDYHQNISNPTALYEVEMINDSGLIIPNIRVVEFDRQEIKKQNSKSFKRFLKIQPAIKHRLVNTNPEKTNDSNIQLGDNDVNPWAKNFKLRLISKSTGKKIDINFKFDYKKPI